MKKTTKALLGIAVVLGLGTALFRGWGGPASAGVAQGTPMASLLQAAIDTRFARV